MLYACVIAYNEELLLPGCLESLTGRVDEVLVVDGRYAQFPGEGWASTDATMEIARCYGARAIEAPGRPWRDQMEKRTAYLAGQEGDWYLRIDADERLVGPFPHVGNDGPGAYALRCVWWQAQAMQPWVACLFRHEGWMRYEGAHCALWSDERLVSRLENCKRWERAHLVHLTMHREAGRQRAKREYYQWQRKAERAFRDENRI